MNVDQARLTAELKRMRQLIASDPRVLARFDTDGNGVIDGEEWEAVRQLVVHRLQREAMEAEEARRLYEQLDPEQAAELARMEADMESAHDQGAADEPTPLPTPPPARDFEGVELAFDPRTARAASHADDIYRRELDPLRSARNVRLGEQGTLADCSELILEQTGGVKQLFGNMFRRAYLVRDGHGEEVGRIGQHENEALQDLTDYSIFTDPDINFTIHDEVSGEEFSLRRTSGLGDNSITLFNPRQRVVATASWTLSFVRRRYEVRIFSENISYYVQRRFLRPWTYEILDPFDEPIGSMHRGWSGLGFLTGGNLFHIELDQPTSPEAMWGFLATALLADLDSEPGSRRAGLDLFNN